MPVPLEFLTTSLLVGWTIGKLVASLQKSLT